MNISTKFSFALLLTLFFAYNSFAFTARNNKPVRNSCTLTVFANATPATCLGNNGSITALPSGGTSPYTYGWTTGGTSQTISGLSVGTYTVTVTDATSCTATASAVVTQTFGPSVSLISDTVCTGSCTGALSPNVFGGKPPYSYSWSNGMTTAMITGLCSGTYTFTVMDGNGCVTTASASVTIESSIPGFTITPTITNSSCFNSPDGSILVTTSGSTAPFRYEWGSTYGSSSYNNLTPNTYTLTVRDKNNSCNIYTYTVSNNYSCSYLSGYTFNDTNFNCIKNIGEPAVKGSYITITPGSYVVYPNSAGYYTQELPYGSYTVTQTLLTGSPFAACSASQPVTVNASTPQINFADTTHAKLSDPMITYLSATPILVGDSCSALFQVKNNGSDTSNGTVFFTIGDSLTFIYSIPTYLSYSRDTVYWNYTGLPPGGTLNYSVHCVADTSILTRWIHYYYAGVIPSNTESNSQNDIMPWGQLFGVACDPNSKLVSPPGQGPNGYIQTTDSVFTYLIHFQNVGSAVAQNIYLVDTISSKLDINTLKVLGASNTFSYTVTGNRVRFIFSNINLPDSIGNQNGSKGWIEYQIHQNKANGPGDVINNTAYIYFDYNAPVITNTTVNTIPIITSVANVTKPEQLSIYPNPTSGKIYLTYTLSKSSAVKLQVLDLLGREVISEEMGTKPAGKQQDIISVESLSAGSYILRLQTGNSTLNKKLVIIR